MTDLTELIDKCLQEADECEMLGGLAATHDERIRYRERAEKLRCLASEARARVILDRCAPQLEWLNLAPKRGGRPTEAQPESEPTPRSTPTGPSARNPWTGKPFADEIAEREQAELQKRRERAELQERRERAALQERRERAARERAERERAERERAEQMRQEQAARERAERERAEQERKDRERRARHEGTRAWWEVLCVDPTATLAEIRASFCKKVQQYHPDLVTNLGPEIVELAERHTKEINRAFEEAKRQARAG